VSELQTITLYNADTTRSCGDCQLCCKLLPLPELKKPANKKCRHQKFNKGCLIYANRPMSCQSWSCRWLMSLDTADLPRPDRSHYVIDPMPDFVRMVDNTNGGLVANVEVVQVWCDPDYPDAHRDPALRRYLLRRGDEMIAALVRYDSKRAFAIIPPQMTADKEWHEHRDGMREKDHTVLDYLAAGEENVRLAEQRKANDG
jgi:hypothetical protein